MKALDIETKSLVQEHPEYALQPWRLLKNESEITLIAMGDGDLAEFIPWKELNGMPKETFVTWNAIFDVSYLHAQGVDVARHTWVDAMLLCKWHDNCQHNEQLGYSLAACAQRWIPQWQYLPQFIKLKAAEADPSHDKYWQVRAKLDVMATYLIAQVALGKLTPKQRKSAMIEAKNIVPNAKAYVRGIPTNPSHYELPIPGLSRQMAEIECRLGVSNTGNHIGGKGWEPSKILRSPKQLAETIYNKWGLHCNQRTPKGEPSTDKAALTYLADKDDKVLEILAWRELNTRLTKFCQSPVKASKYLSDSVLHPEPKIFSTYTGRYTYASKIKSKFPIAMALHQIPRGPDVRRMVEAPEGKLLVEFDASGQEARLLAEIGDVHSMLDVFRSGKKIHAVMGASIAGIPYDEFMRRYKAGEEAYAGPSGTYYCGKFVNLSMQYRVGAAKQRVMARVQYGLRKDQTTIERWRALYHHTYPEVKSYWQRAINLARERGYAETLAGRRYYLDKWGKDDRWGTESSAINFPIQGSGGDMKNLAISMLNSKYPELEFAWDLHDGVFVWAEKSKFGMELVLEARDALDNLDYESAWGWKPRIKMPWDAAVGVRWGDMKELR